MAKEDLIKLDPSKSQEKWFVFPDQLPNRRFLGFENRDDETQRQGSFVIGQNVEFTDAQTPTVRRGYEAIGDEAVDATPVKRGWVFEKRDGVQIEFKTYDTGVYVWVHGVSYKWDLLKGSFTAAQEFAFANIGQTDQTVGWCFFCNGVENPFRWTGVYATYASDNGSNQITVNGSTTLANLGFTATGSLVINGETITYTGLNNQTFTGCSGVPANFILSSYSEANQDDYQRLRSNAFTELGEWFQASRAASVTSCKFYMMKTGSPTGNAVAKLYLLSTQDGSAGTPTGSALATSDNFDVSTLTGAYQLTTFTFSTPYSVESGKYYAIVVTYDGGDFANYIRVGTDSSSPGNNSKFVIFDSSESIWYYSGDWNPASLFDTIFYVYGDVTTDDVILQAPIELTGAVGGGVDPDKFSIAMAHDGRLHFRRESKESVWVYSKLDNPDDINGSSANDGEANAKEVEFGGSITAFGKLNKTALCFKNRVIKFLDFIQVGSRIDVPKYGTLVSADDKSTTLGAINQKSTFATPKGMVFVTPDKKMLLLTGITQNEQPQYLTLSDPIQSIFDQGVHDEATGILFDNKIYYAFKETKDSTANDTVIVGDLDKVSFDAEGQPLPIFWSAPYTGWNVNDWTIIYNSTDKKYELHWHSSFNSNVYRMIEEKVDNGTSFTSIIRTHSETFGAPFYQKRIDACMLEIKMLENTEVTVTLLYDVDGYTSRAEYILRGSDTDNLVQGAEYNPFGASPFGYQKIGSNDQQTEMKRYIYELEVNPNIRFWGVSLQISGDQENNDWELVRYSYKLCEYIKKTDNRFKKSTS